MNYQLEQTGEQVQDTLNQAPITEQNLQNEITRSTGKDEELEAAIGNEKNRAEGVEAELQTAIGNENARAEGVEGELSTAIANEKSRAEGVEGGLRTDVDGIEAKIPTGASEQNKLATENFVNSSVATNTADFKGTFPSLEALQTEVHDANANDYAFVISTDASGNTVYNRYKYVTGTGWVFEYALNNSSFTAAQWAAIQSGITALLVAKLAGLPTVAELTQQLNTIIASVSDEQTRAEGAEAVLRQSIADNTTAIANEKTRAQNEEGTLSTNIVNEENRAKAAEVVLQQNIDAEAILRDNADDALQAQIDGIEAKIPEQASASNQLADKSFVNSSIATNTADFKGTYNSLQELQQVSANNNDYGFVVSVDSDGNTVYNRYKYVDGTGWVFEYALNNSSFTSAQWAAIQSGITAALVAKINGLPDITALNAMFAAITNLIPSAATSENKLVDYAQMVAALATKQNTLTFDNVPTEGSNNPVKSGGVYSAIATVTAAIVGLQSSKQDVLTFDQYPTAGSDNPVKSKGIYEKLSEKQATLVPGTNLDTTPTANSNNPVTSGGVKAALDLKANQSTLAEEVSRAQGAESALSSRISTNATDIANLQQLYNDLQQSKPVPVTALPSTGQQQGVIYRLAGTTSYSDYMWNGSSWVLMATYNNAIDPRPKKASQNLVTSGGVFDNMGALDVSELNATENPHTPALYADLSAALAAIQTDYQKGGMSIKFIQGTVQSSDNKYVQYRLMADEFTTDTKDWAIAEEGVYVENPEFIYVKTDKNNKILWAIKTDGGIYYGAGVPQQVVDYINEKIAELSLDEYEDIVAFLNDLEKGDKTLQSLLDEKVDKEEGKSLIPTQYIQEIESPEFIAAYLDNDDKILFAIKKNADIYFGYGCPEQIKNYVENYINIGGNSIRAYLDATFGKYIEDPEDRIEIKTDSDGKIISYRDRGGVIHEGVGINTNHLELTGQGMNDFQQALKDSGFTPGGAGDYSDTITEKGKKPVFIPTPRLAMVNIIWDGNLSNLSKSDRPDGVQKVNYDVKVPVEFFDGQGVYFKKYALMSAQGNSSMAFIKKNISLKFFDTEDVEGKKKKWGKGDTFGTVFGNWVMQKTYHLKAFYTDFIRGSSEVAYQLADEVYKTRGVYADRPWKKALIDFSKITSATPAGLSEDGIDDMNLQIDNGARCMPDGFPVIVYQNGEFYGIYVWMLKKDADNFNMDTSEVKHIHIDGDLYASNLWGGSINWTQFEIRNPEDLICIDGSDYDGDHPKELIDSTATGVYDPENENHVRSAQVKQYIIDLSTRVGEINALTPTYTRPDETVITLNDFKGSYNIDASYGRGNYVLDQQGGNTYYMSLHSSNVGHALTDTDYWHDITEDIATVKAEFEKYFDIDNLVDYQLINMACGDTDGFGKNWQWTTWDGVKWYVNQYDKDMAFGNYFTGMFTTAPKTGWLGNKTNLPSGLAIRYYQAEHKTRWQELVNAGIFNAEHIKSMITAWISRVGKNNFVQEWKKWSESPCNRSSKIDFEHWKFTGDVSSVTPSTGTIWDANTSYSVGDKVWFNAFDGTWYLQFEAVKAGDNHPCLTGSYSIYPMSMGYRDSAWRYYKYIERTISNQNGFINSL